MYLSICLSVYLSTYVPCLSLSRSRSLSIYLRVILPLKGSSCARLSSKVDVNRSRVQNEASVQEFLIFGNWQHQKTKQFCGASFKNGKLSAKLTASCERVLRFFHPICLQIKYCPCHEVLHLSRKIIWRSDALKRSPSQEISGLIS